MALRLMIILVLLGGLLVARSMAASLNQQSSMGNSALKAVFGSGPVQRVRVGFDPNAPGRAASASTTEPVVSAAPAAPPQEVSAPPPPLPTAVPTAPAASGERLQVANTDGVGVVLYTAPRKDARVPRGLLEGAKVTALERVDQWVRVRADNGLEGWVPAEYLVKAN